MEGQHNLTDILAYLNAKGFNFGSEKALSQCCRDLRTVWNILSTLFKHIQPSFIRNILATQSHQLGEDIQKHKYSMTFITNYMIIQEIFNEIGAQFRLIHFVKPTPQQVCHILGKAIDFCKWHEKLRSKYEEILIKFNLSEKDYRKHKQKNDEVTSELKKTEDKKAQQRPLYIQKMEYLTSIKSEITQQKSYKGRRLLDRKEIENDISNFERQYDELIYSTQNDQITISRLKREIAQNAPEIKKQKKNAEESLNYLQTVTEKEISNLQSRINGIHSALQRHIENSGEIWRGEQLMKFRDTLYILQTNKERQNEKIRNTKQSIVNLITNIETLEDMSRNQREHQSIQKSEIQKEGEAENKLEMKLRNLEAKLQKNKQQVLSLNRIINQRRNIQNGDEKRLIELQFEYNNKMKFYQKQIDLWSTRAKNLLLKIQNKFNS